MGRYFNFGFYNFKSSAGSVSDMRTFEQKFTEAAKKDFVYMDESSKCPDLQGVKSNDDMLQTSKGQLFNAKGEFVNGLAHAAYAAGNTLLATSHAVGAAASLHSTFAVVTNIGGWVNEAKTILQVATGAEELVRKGEDAYNRLVGNPVNPHEPTKLDKAYSFAKQADNLFHEKTGYLTMALNAAKTYFYPENLIGFFSRVGKVAVNTYEAVKCEISAASALAKAGYYEAKEAANKVFADSSQKTDEDASSYDLIPSFDASGHSEVINHQDALIGVDGATAAGFVA